MYPPTFESLLAALDKGRVEFILDGGLAVALCGFPRATFDLEVLVEDSEDNLERLLQVLSTFGSGSARELSPADFTREEGCIRVNKDFPVDIFTLINGNTYPDLLPYSQTHLLENGSLRYLGPEGLVMLKQDSLRPQDRLDVEVLKKILEENP